MSTASRASLNILPYFRGHLGSRGGHIGDGGNRDVVELYLMSPRGGAKQWAPIYTQWHRQHTNTSAPSPSACVLNVDQSLI